MRSRFAVFGSVAGAAACAVWLARASFATEPPEAPTESVRSSPALGEHAPMVSARNADEPPTASESVSEEGELVQAARDALETDPAEALERIAEADRRFGARDETRRQLEIEALVRIGRIGQAHSRADRFYRDFPESPAIPELARRTGYHPRPWGP